jgi:predicted glycosyltransferase
MSLQILSVINSKEEKMKILIDIGHPATVHFFKNYAWEMIKRGNQVLFTSRDKDVAVNLLRHYKFDYKSFGKFKKGFIGKILSIMKFDLQLIKTAIKAKPDIILSGGSLYAAHAAFFLRKPNITVHNTDIDYQVDFNKPFTSVFLTPESYMRDIGKKQVKYRGYQELTFLHPKYFKPNPSIFKKLGLQENEKYVLLRFVSWDAHDDFGKNGFSLDEIRKIVSRFSEYARVFISSEYNLPDDLKKYHLESNTSIQTGDIQDIEYYASLLYGESGAMSAECAVLGTPAFYISKKQLGFLIELDKKYNLIFNRPSSEGTLEEAIQLLKTPGLKDIWREKSRKMVEDNINVTDFLLWFTENYPSSLKKLREDPDFQFSFK